MVDVGKRIKMRRKEMGFSAEKVAEMMGVSPATIYRYESNHILNMGTDKLERLAAVLRTTPEYLMGWEAAQKNNDTIAGIVAEMRVDDDFFALVKAAYALDSQKRAGLRQMLDTLYK